MWCVVVEGCLAGWLASCESDRDQRPTSVGLIDRVTLEAQHKKSIKYMY